MNGRSRHSGDKSGEGMGRPADLARQIEAERTKPLPGSDPYPDPFPAAERRVLWASVLVGAGLGAVLGLLLDASVIVIPGAAQMFSDGPVTVVALLTTLGISLGLIVAALVAPFAVAAPTVSGEQPRRTEASRRDVVERRTVDEEDAEEEAGAAT